MLDFADPGDIGVYVSRELLAAREPALLAGQRIHGSELAGAFASLRANDLVWNYVVHNYLKGETPPAFDLLHWNGDSANLPGPMYVYYLTQHVPRQRAARRRCADDGRRVRSTSRDVTVPAYVVASRDDHIVPWRSAYKSTTLLGGDATFVLGASGHIAGVDQSAGEEPAQLLGERRGSPTTPTTGSPARRATPGAGGRTGRAWLKPHGGALRAAPSAPGSARHPALEAAPGRYVLESSA